MSPYVPVVWFGWLWWLELCTHKILFKNNVNPSMLLSSPKNLLLLPPRAISNLESSQCNFNFKS